jgi:hypothetical protein
MSSTLAIVVLLRARRQRARGAAFPCTSVLTPETSCCVVEHMYPQAARKRQSVIQCRRVPLHGRLKTRTGAHNGVRTAPGGTQVRSAAGLSRRRSRVRVPSLPCFTSAWLSATPASKRPTILRAV